MSGPVPRIETQADVDAGAAWLARSDPRFAALLAQTGPLPLRLRPGGFAGLVEIITGQQVSTASAAAIRTRLASAGLLEAPTVCATGQAALCAAGLSRPKARYVEALARADLDYGHLSALSDAQAMDTLQALPGIGPWSAQIYVMFCMGRADIFPAGDLALREAARVFLDLPERPATAQLAETAVAWSPWRSVAARALFAYYRVIKRRDGI